MEDVVDGVMHKPLQSTLWFGLLGGMMMFLGGGLMVWDYLHHLSRPLQLVVSALPFFVASGVVWLTRSKVFSPVVQEAINACWIGSWWFSALMVGHFSHVVELDWHYCLWVTLLTFPMIGVRYSHTAVGLMTLLMIFLSAGAWCYDVSYFYAFLLVVCAFAPFVICWMRWRLLLKQQGVIAIVWQWVYALALVCYGMLSLPIMVLEAPAFEVLFPNVVLHNIVSLSLVAPLLLGSLGEKDLPLYRRPLMLMGLCGLGAFSFLCSAVEFHSVWGESLWEHLARASVMLVMVLVTAKKTCYREGLFLPFIPFLYVSLFIPYAFFVMPLIVGAVMIWISLRRNEMLMSYLSLGYSLASLWLGVLSIRGLSFVFCGGMLMLCGGLCFVLNRYYNQKMKRGEG